MRIILLARHGESIFNVEGLVNADPALDRGLSARGEEEARALGVQLAGLPIDLVATSRFPRAQQTATLAVPGDVPRVVLAGLDDVNVGELEGEPIAAYRDWKRGRSRSERFPGGESLDEAAARYASSYRELAARSERVTLVVCHEIPVRYAINASAGSELLDRPAHDIANATPYAFTADTLAAAADRIAALSRSGEAPDG